MAAQGWLPIKFPGRTKTTSVLGLVSLLYHHQAFRDDTRKVLYSSTPSNASDVAITAMRPLSYLIGSGDGKGALRKKRDGV
jgi:hypothetical protein